MTPKTIKVLIEGDDTEKDAKLLSFSEMYNAGLYETDDGREFYVDPELIIASNDSKEAVPVPIAVITHRERQQAKLAWAQNELDRLQEQEKSTLLLPDGYKA